MLDLFLAICIQVLLCYLNDPKLLLDCSASTTLVTTILVITHNSYKDTQLCHVVIGYKICNMLDTFGQSRVHVLP